VKTDPKLLQLPRVFEIHHPALALGVQRPVEVDVEECAQGRGRVAVSPAIATDPEPDDALAFDLPGPD
jgi:hypothetical protein